MSLQPPIPAELWDQIPPAAQAAIMALVQRYERQLQNLPIRAEVESLLLRGYFDARVRGFCKGLWEHRQNLWTFVEVEGVEPTDNAAEQALRQAVIWRKLSFGTQSSAGSRFVERLLTVVETCRRQKRNVLSWMVEAVEARFAGNTAPSLLAGV